MKTLRVRIELNPGGVGVRMDKLARVSGEMEKFFRFLIEDLKISGPNAVWISKRFYNSSVGYNAEFEKPIDEVSIAAFNNAAKFFIDFNPDVQKINGKFRPQTIRQFVSLGKEIDADETVKIGLFENGADDPTSWKPLTRRPALDVERIIEEPLKYFGSIQGPMGTWYKESNHFDIREVVFNALVKCYYDNAKYEDVHALYQDKSAVVHVSGDITANRLDGRPQKISISRLKVYDHLSDKEFHRLFRSAPNLTGDESTIEFIDRTREDGDA